jgi:hypothetical protein
MINVVLKCILEILTEGSLSGELNNLFMKIAFLNATSSHTKKRPCGAIFSLIAREGEALGPAESEIWPADQTGKLRTGLPLYVAYILPTSYILQHPQDDSVAPLSVA